MSQPDRIIIATPVDGHPRTASVSLRYHAAVSELMRMGSVAIPAKLCFSDDLARARSRSVWYALQRPDWDWVLWWDDDVSVDDLTIIPRMIALAKEDGHEMIGAPYPRKRIPADFPYKPLRDQLDSRTLQVRRDCLEVEFMGFGFVLTSRKCLESMVEHYADLWYTDAHDQTNIHETAALFWPVMGEPETVPDGKGGTMRFRELHSEDYSFCIRWRRMGGKIAMYVGKGAPLGHVGGHLFTGTIEDLGRFG